MEIVFKKNEISNNSYQIQTKYCEIVNEKERVKGSCEDYMKGLYNLTEKQKEMELEKRNKFKNAQKGYSIFKSKVSKMS